MMMKLLFNGNLIEDSVPWSATDRAFQYGDGFFETMLFANGSVALLSYHLRRVHEAAATMQFVLQESDFGFLEENIETLVQLNEIETPFVRAKLIIWRRAAGQRGYRSTEKHVNWALMVFPHDSPTVNNGLRIATAENIRLTPSPWSGFKSLNALPYVFAGMECESRLLDDLILLNTSQLITECIESNIFWFQSDVWHTPARSTGCIAGSMRAWVLDHFRNNNIPFREVEVGEEDLKVEKAFTCNATGFRSINEWNSRQLEENIAMLEAFSGVLGW